MEKEGSPFAQLVNEAYQARDNVPASPTGDQEDGSGTVTGLTLQGDTIRSDTTWAPPDRNIRLGETEAGNKIGKSGC